MSLNKLVVQIGAEISDFERKMSVFEARIEKISDKTQKVGESLSKYLTLPVMAFGGLALKSAGDFEAGMNKVMALTNATGAEFAKLQSKAKELGSSTQYSATQSAEAMSYLAMAGFKVDQILSSMPSTLKLASSANMDLASSADIVSNVLTGYQMKVEELPYAVDVLAKAFTTANTDLRMLGEAMKYVGPVASGFGVAMEETTALIQALSDAGIQSTMAGTSLRNIMTRLMTDAKKLGIQTKDSSGNLRSMADILDELSAKGITATEVMEIFGDRGGPAMQVLISKGGQAIREMTSTLEEAGGTADRIANTQMRGLNGALKEMASAWEGLQLAIASSGLLDFALNLVKRITGLISTISQLNPQFLKTTAIVLGVGAALGPVLIVMSKMALSVVPMLIMAYKGLSSALFLLTSPISLVVGAIGLLAIAFYKNYEVIKPVVVNIINYFIKLYNETDIVRAGVEVLVATFKTAFYYIESAIKSVWKALSGIGEVITAIFSGELDKVPEIFKRRMKDLEENGKNFGDNVANAWVDAFNNVKEKKQIDLITEADLDIAKGKLDKFLASLNPMNLLDKYAPIAGGSKNEEETSIGGKKKFDGIIKPELPKLLEETGRKVELLSQKELKLLEVREELSRKNKEASKEAQVFGGSFDLLQAKTENYKEAIRELLESGFEPTDDAIKKVMQGMETLGEKFDVQTNQMLITANQFNEDLARLFKDHLVNTIVEVGNSIGGALSGAMDFGGIFQAVLNGFGGFIVQFGKMAIAYGITISKLKVAFANPASAIMAGSALVVLGSAMKGMSSKFFSGGSTGGGGNSGFSGGSIGNIPKLAKGGLAYGPTLAMVGDNPNASNDPEVISPLSKLKKYIGSNGGDFTVHVVGRMQGEDIVFLTEKVQRRLKRQG